MINRKVIEGYINPIALGRSPEHSIALFIEKCKPIFGVSQRVRVTVEWDTECDRCHDIIPADGLQLNEAGNQLLCERCREEKPKEKE